MAQLTIKHPHNLSLNELKPQVDELAKSLREKYGASTRWQGDNVITVKAKGVDGTLTLEEKHLQVNIKLGMMTSFLKPQIEAEIRTYLAAKV